MLQLPGQSGHGHDGCSSWLVGDGPFALGFLSPPSFHMGSLSVKHPLHFSLSHPLGLFFLVPWQVGCPRAMGCEYAEQEEVGLSSLLDHKASMEKVVTEWFEVWGGV